MRRIGVVGKGQGADLEAILVRLAEWAKAHEVELYAEESSLPATVHFGPLTADQDLDLLLALGGDGTLLRTARLRAGQEIPVLGVNMGQLGFLTAAQADDMETVLDQVLAGDHHLDVRFTLEARVMHEGGAPGDHFLALNDFAIHKGGVARVTHLDLSVGVGDGRDEIGSFSGDGVILATPTGSTAYSLSAGGPIVVPDMECIVVTPIAPHSLSVRPLVVSAAESIEIRPKARTEELVLTVDGQFGRALEEGDTVHVRRGEIGIPLVRFRGQTFFTTLRRKLNWAAPPTH
jgi:NAD+ kinase